MANRPFPTADNEEHDASDQVVAYQTDACAKEDPGRIARFVEAEEARLMVASKPWTAVPASADPTKPFFEPIRSDDPDIKLADRNEMAPIIDSEIARLVGSTQEPSVIPTKQTTAVHRAAKKGEAILDDILLRTRWTEKTQMDARNAIQFGTSWILSGWESDLDDMKKGPALVLACTSKPASIQATSGPTDQPAPVVEDEAACGWNMLAVGGEEQPGGGTRFSGDIAREMADAKVGVTVSQPDDKDFFTTIHECPDCGSPLTQRRALPSDGPMDSFGYDNTEETPLPKVFVQVFPDTDVFPIGGGRILDGFMPEVTIETIAPVDWLLQRYKHAKEIEGKSLAEMAELPRWHPAGLEMWGYTGQSMAVDQKRWAAYRITIRQPFKSTKEEVPDEPLGRLMISANKVVLYNGPLLFEYQTAEGETERIPRMRLFPFANELQNHSVHGISTTSRLVGPQKQLNAMMSQFVYDMATNGSPDLLLPKGANIEGQGDGWSSDDGDTTAALPHRVIRFDADAGEPHVISGQVTHHDWVPFSEGLVEHMQRTTTQSQLDQGKSATGAPSASAQMYIGQRLDETRKPKGQRWAERLSALFSYMLECIVAVYTDRRQFKAVDALDNRTVRDFSGADLMGQTNVKVETKPAHDNEAFQRQNILEAIPLNLIDLSTPRQRLRIAKKLGLEDEIDAEPNQQIKDAGDEFLDYTLGDPIVKPLAKKRTDNHMLHGQTHMEDLRSPAGAAMRRMWTMHERATYGWFDKFKALMLAEKRVKEMPAPEPVLMVDQATGQPDTENAIVQAKLYAQDQKLLAQFEKLPDHPQDRIEMIQVKMIEAYGPFQMAPQQDKDDLMALTNWLAHKDCHDWFLLEEQMAATPPPPATQQDTPPRGGPGQSPVPAVAPA